MQVDTSRKVTNRPSKFFTFLKWPLEYFPARLLMLSFLFSFLLQQNYHSIKALEEQILLGIFQFLTIPSFYLDGSLFVGSFHSPLIFTPVLHVHILFLIFFPSLALAARITMKMRAKILLFAGLCFLAFIATQALIVAVLLPFNMLTSVAFVQANTMLTGIVGALVIEAALFSTLTLPSRIKVKRIIKRRYVAEYTFLVALIATSVLLTYFLLGFLGVGTDSPIAAFAAVNLSLVLTFAYYLTSMLSEVRKPSWANDTVSASTQQKNNPSFAAENSRTSHHIPISFLIPVYNEEKTIRKCIESIDRAASKYRGKTELVVINDGSTDKTEEIISQALKDIRYCEARAYTIPNSGKGSALKFGLEKTTGEIIFRIDADSVIDENAIAPIIAHFKDPQVGSVSGMIWPIEVETVWQKLNILLGCLNLYYKRIQDTFDSILCQPGAFSVFRKDALSKVGSWSDSQSGEDGEITMRLARAGYKNQFEQHAVLLSETPASVRAIREQRIRWCIGYYQTRAGHFDALWEFNGPRSVLVLINIITHGLSLANFLFLPYLASAILAGTQVFSVTDLPSVLGISIKLTIVGLTAIFVKYLIFVYFLHKFRKIGYLKYIPMLKLYFLLIQVFFKPEAMEILLAWSSRWKMHSKDAYEDLRKEILNRSSTQ